MKSIKCLSCGMIWGEGNGNVVGYLAHECEKPDEVAFAEDLARLDNELADLGLVLDDDVNVFYTEHEDEDVLGYYEDDGIAVELPAWTRKTRTVVEIPLVAVVGLSLLTFYAYDRLAEKVRRAIGVR